MRSFAIHTRRLTGPRALLLAWGVWGFCLVAAPISPRLDADPVSVLLLISANIALLIGLSVGSVWRQKSAACKAIHFQYQGHAIDLVMIALTVLGSIAIVARLIDYFGVRQVPIGACIEEVRT